MLNSKKNMNFFFFLSIFAAINQSASTMPESYGEPSELTRLYTRPSLHKKTIPQPNQPDKGPGSVAEWTILILIQASNNLESFAHTNMKEMMKWGSTPTMNILVDLHKAGDKSWRYKIEKGCCTIEEVSARNAHSTIEEEVFISAEWAVTQYPAKKYAIIFWNHGLGCIDPQITVNRPGYLSAYDNSWRLPMDYTGNQTISRALRNIIPADRSILFDDERQTYLSNTALRSVLKDISTKLLNGQKINLIGMDACLMGMIEIADQIKEYAEHFVASEEFEFAQGWPYGEIIERLSATPTMNSKELGSVIVHAYERYYTNKTSYYTQSCIDLSKITTLKENINALAQLLLLAKKEDRERSRNFIQQARTQALSFSLADYIDLRSLYQEILKLTQSGLDTGRHKSGFIARFNEETYKKLQTTLELGLTTLKETVVANTAGKYLARAGGLSIYFPQKLVDQSYLETQMAQTTAWGSFIIDQTISRF